MKLQEYLEGTGWGLATKEDNQKILGLYHGLPMQSGAFNIKFVKSPDYFKFMSYESDFHRVVCAKDGEGNFMMMGSMSLRPCYIEGKIASVVHFSDLRVLPKSERKGTSKAIDWKKWALAWLANFQDIDEMKGCRYTLGSYVVANRKAVTAFKERSPFGISEIARYHMVSIIGRKPLKLLGRKSRKNPGMKVTVSIGSNGDINALRDFLDRQNKKRMLGYVFAGEHDELARRFRQWDDFSISSFYIAKNEAGAIIGCFAVWNPTKGRRIMIDKFPRSLGIVANMAKLFGKKAPKEGDELEILYLTTLELDHGLTQEQKIYVFHELLDSLYKSGINKKYHMLSFCDYDRESIIGGMERDYIIQKTATHLYEEVHPDSKDIIKEEDFDVHVGHEMVLT